ncbi:MAG TPA: VCBS repeat-containing protein [Planctomycetota bacterium]|nr:VCBS repeat-containing protein [Planctomycetota bacterium]
MNQVRTTGFIGLVALFTLLGAGQQDPPTSHRLAATPTYSIKTEDRIGNIHFQDVNGDGFPDLICAGNNGGDEAPSFIYLSKEGRFDKPSWKSSDDGVSSGIALADLDGDGDEDLVLTRYNHNPAVAYRNLGKGSFERSPFWTSADTEWARYVVVGDFDGDGHKDILADDRIYRGSKDGPSTKSDWKLDGDPAISGMTWTDVDGDGIKDLVIGDWNGGAAYSVYRGLKKDFEGRPSYAASRRGEFDSPAVGDIDGDGFPEIVVGSSTFRSGDGRVRMYANRKGKPAPEPSWVSDDIDCNVNSVRLADFDNDKDLDLLVLADDHTAIFENRSGKLETQPCWRATIKDGCAFVGDIDKNGWLDLVVAGDKDVRFYLSAPTLTGAKAEAPKPEPFPPLPKLPPLTRRDPLPNVDPEMESLIANYRKSRDADLLATLRSRAAPALSAIELLEASDLAGLVEDLKPLAAKSVELHIKRLSSEKVADREDASARLAECGPMALSELEKIAASDNPEAAARAQLIIERMAFDTRGPQVIDLLGMKLARLTSRLGRRYGHKETHGVVVLEVAESVGPGLGLTNLREGDLFLGVGDLGEYGRNVTPVKTPLEMAGQILLQDAYDKDPDQPDRDWRLAGYRYVCGPLHPTVRGSKRQWRMSFSMKEWDSIKEAVRSPKTWTPEK